ncbi:MAG: FG-GAP-like repeat-containing protein [Agarilytica sp.]
MAGRFLSVFTAIFVFLFSLQVQAVEFDSNLYDVYYGDVDEDSDGDIYFHPKDRIVLLHGDIITPIVLPKALGFYISSAEYPNFSEIQLVELTADQISEKGLFLTSEHTDYFYGDFDGDGISDVLVRGASETSPALQLAGSQIITQAPNISHIYESSSVPSGHHISNRSLVLTVTDANGDGVDDLVAYSGSVVNVGYLNNGGELAYYSGAEYRLATTTVAVGATGGSHDVGVDGSALYGIPIAVSEGIAGMQPSISLSYSSSAGNSHVGMGWGLGGLSNIQRCGMNYDNGGKLDEVDFDANDRFCLDGQPLVAISGAYGEDQTEYRTRSETYLKIKSYGQSGNCTRGISANKAGPQKFRVWTASGHVHEYGFSEDSRVEAQGCTDVLVWAINKQEDRYGNSVNYHYTESTYDHYISSIDYNAGASRVEFGYADREDSDVIYSAGSRKQQTKLLNKITSLEGGILLREYHLEHELVSSSSVSRLKSLVECTVTECLPATDFSWTDGSTSSSLAFNQRISSNICQNFSGDCNDTDNFNYIYYADINGDARTDICYRSDSGIRCHLATAQGFTGTIISTDICANGSNSYGVCNDGDNFDTIRFIDMDADGLADLVFRSDGGIRVMRSTGTNFVPFINSSVCANGWDSYGKCNDQDNSNHLKYPDLNGDALPDVCYRGDEGIHCLLNTGSGFGDVVSTNICANNSGLHGKCNDGDNYDTISYVDINADGMADLVVRTDNGIRAWRFDGTGFTAAIVSTICSNGDLELGECNDSDNHYTIKFPDINGDGIADLCYRGDMGIRCEIGTGYSWDGGSIITDICRNGATENGTCNDDDNYRTISYNDLNQDGRADIIFRSDAGIFVFKSTGFGFEKIFSSSVCANGDWGNGICNDPDNHDTIQVIDFDANGLPDIVYRGDDGVQLWPLYVDQQNLMTKVTNGFGVETKFTYKLLSDPSVYTKTYDPTITYPEKEVVHPGKVVFKTEKSDGLGAYNTTSYSYKGLRIHQKGLGVLGFTEMRTVNEDTGLAINNRFSMDYLQRQHGHVVETTTTAADGSTVLLYSENEWYPLTSWGSADTYRYQLRPSKTTTTERDLNGAFLKTEVIRTLNYDEFGSPAQVITELFEEDGETLVRTGTLDFIYNHDSTNWFIGRKQRLTTTVAVTGRAPRIKVASWEYDSLTSRITVARIHEPLTDIVMHETRYGEDEFGETLVDTYGNNLAITVKGPDFTTRTNKVEFDPSGRRVEAKIGSTEFTLSTEYYALNDTENGAYPYKPKFVTSANGIIIHTQFDSFGRVISNTAAWGTSAQRESSTEYRICDTSCPSSASYYIVSKAEKSPESRVYKDMLGRTLLEKSQVVKVYGEAPTWVNTEYQYNHLGQNYRVSAPYFDGATTKYWTESVFDDLGRVVQVTHPDQRVDNTTFDGLVVTTRTDINGKNQQNTTTNNILGELVSVLDNTGEQLQYTYDSHGNVRTTSDMFGNTIEVFYDSMGRKVGMNDPDKGEWFYSYNGLGQLVTQTNARNETTCSAYDLLGRRVKRIDNYGGSLSSVPGQVSQASNQCAGDENNSEVAHWVYDTAPGAALGKLHKVLGQNGYEDEIIYDGLGRATENVKTINGEYYRTATSFDAFGRPETTTYPGISNRLQIKNIYNSLGMLVEVRNAVDNALYYQLGELDARGNIVSEILGNGVETRRTYKDNNGRLDTIVSDLGITIGGVQNLQFTFDSLGNLDYREDHKNNFREDFIYDTNNRLKTSAADYGNGDLRTTQVTYDSLGNILTKSGVGSYKYGSQCENGFGPHAVCEIRGNKNADYIYDVNGNMTSGDGRSISYTSFDKPDQIIKGLNTTDIYYGPTRSRYFRQDSVDTQITRYTYVGGIYEKVEFLNDGVSINKTEERHYIGGFAIITLEDRSAEDSGNAKTRYLHKDHIGSITAITDEGATVVEEFSFDPWGKRRAASLDELEFLHGPWAGLTTNQKHNLTTLPNELASLVTNRGFTGHEQMDTVGLIHMNGRVYDAELGRFIQADPVLQAPTDLQSYNRYSYVRNNPLSLVDPSGYSWLSKQYKSIKKNAVKAWQGFLKYNSNYQVYKKAQNEFFRATIKVHNNRREKDGIYRDVTDYVATHKWSRDVILAVVAFYTAGNPAAIAATQSAFATIQGARPNDIRRAGDTAFVTSVFSSVVSSYVATTSSMAVNFAVDRAVGYMVGAAANKGHFGSFKDYMIGWAESAALNFVVGRVAGAFETWGSGEKGLGDVAGSGTPEQRAAFQAKLDALATDGTLSRSHSFDSADAAAKSVLGVTAPLSAEYGLEVTGNIFSKDGSYYYTLPQIGGPTQGTISIGWIGYHTHPSGSLKFSNSFRGAGPGRDTHWVQHSGKALYLGVQTSSGVGFAVCEPGGCFDVGRFGSTGRTLK